MVNYKPGPMEMVLGSHQRQDKGPRWAWRPPSGVGHCL